MSAHKFGWTDEDEKEFDRLAILEAMQLGSVEDHEELQALAAIRRRPRTEFEFWQREGLRAYNERLGAAIYLFNALQKEAKLTLIAR